ncbi:hypothetical protein B0H13DRAFT_1931306 [Mycena leptocephala]|nr:hypothetical protein B0H13DRAFT_1931306 [Mycena leptocephala]
MSKRVQQAFLLYFSTLFSTLAAYAPSAAGKVEALRVVPLAKCTSINQKIMCPKRPAFEIGRIAEKAGRKRKWPSVAPVITSGCILSDPILEYSVVGGKGGRHGVFAEASQVSSGATTSSRHCIRDGKWDGVDKGHNNKGDEEQDDLDDVGDSDEGNRHSAFTIGTVLSHTDN